MHLGVGVPGAYRGLDPDSRLFLSSTGEGFKITPYGKDGQRRQLPGHLAGPGDAESVGLCGGSDGRGNRCERIGGERSSAMKPAIAILSLFLAIPCCNAQTPKEKFITYSLQIERAETAAAHGKHAQAMDTYDSAFALLPFMGYDYFDAVVNALKAGSDERANELLIQGTENGLILKGQYDSTLHSFLQSERCMPYLNMQDYMRARWLSHADTVLMRKLRNVGSWYVMVEDSSGNTVQVTDSSAFVRLMALVKESGWPTPLTVGSDFYRAKPALQPTLRLSRQPEVAADLAIYPNCDEPGRFATGFPRTVPRHGRHRQRQADDLRRHARILQRGSLEMGSGRSCDVEQEPGIDRAWSRRGLRVPLQHRPVQCPLCGTLISGRIHASATTPIVFTTKPKAKSNCSVAVRSLLSISKASGAFSSGSASRLVSSSSRRSMFSSTLA